MSEEQLLKTEHNIIKLESSALLSYVILSFIFITNYTLHLGMIFKILNTETYGNINTYVYQSINERRNWQPILVFLLGK